MYISGTSLYISFYVHKSVNFLLFSSVHQQFKWSKHTTVLLASHFSEWKLTFFIIPKSNLFQIIECNSGGCLDDRLQQANNSVNMFCVFDDSIEYCKICCVNRPDNAFIWKNRKFKRRKSETSYTKLFLLFPADIERYLFDKYSELWIKYSQMSINFKQQKNRKH